jgi:hypothetical protein
MHRAPLSAWLATIAVIPMARRASRLSISRRGARARQSGLPQMLKLQDGHLVPAIGHLADAILEQQEKLHVAQGVAARASEGRPWSARGTPERRERVEHGGGRAARARSEGRVNSRTKLARQGHLRLVPDCAGMVHERPVIDLAIGEPWHRPALDDHEGDRRQAEVACEAAHQCRRCRGHGRQVPMTIPRRPVTAASGKVGPAALARYRPATRGCHRVSRSARSARRCGRARVRRNGRCRRS